jgi:quercetin dioxygenase-like cupin family protein
MAEIPGGAQTGKHMHPGEEVGYVVEGTLTVEIDGKPTMTYKAGQAFIVPAGQPHNGKNAGTGMTKVLANYIIEKGKPVATPVP